MYVFGAAVIDAPIDCIRFTLEFQAHFFHSSNLYFRWWSVWPTGFFLARVFRVPNIDASDHVSLRGPVLFHIVHENEINSAICGEEIILLQIINYKFKSFINTEPSPLSSHNDVNVKLLRQMSHGTITAFMPSMKIENCLLTVYSYSFTANANGFPLGAQI